jgi:stage III sporulation protein AF
LLATLSDVVRNIAVLIILVTILELILPRSSFKPFVNMVVGLILMLLLLSPLRLVLQLPGAIEPVWEMQQAVSQADIDARAQVMEQMNWELTLSRYRELMGERVAVVLEEEGYRVQEWSLVLEEDPSHMGFGHPQEVVVLAVRMEEREERFGRVERIRVEIGEETVLAPQESHRNGRLENIVAEALGLRSQKVEVRVLNSN